MEKLLDYLFEQLAVEFGKGFTVCDLRAMRQFYCLFPIRHILCAELYIFNLLHIVERIELVLLSAFDACSGGTGKDFLCRICVACPAAGTADQHHVLPAHFSRSA